MAVTSWINAVGRWLAGTSAEARPVYLDRVAAFDAFDAYYHNTVYDPLSQGGQREQINATLGNASAADLAGLYNPVASVVDLYQHVYGGQFRPSTDDPAADDPSDIRAESANPAVLPALDSIWQASMINIAKQQLCRLPATHGTVGLRIVAENSPDPTRRRVYLKPEHPRIIRDVEVDSRGNVVAIELEYDMLRGIGDEQEIIGIREILTKEEISTYEVQGEVLIAYDVRAMARGGQRSSYANALGVVPYVLGVHQATGDAFGLNSFYRVRGALDRLNALASHIDTQIIDHVKVDWFIAAEGAPPARLELNGRNVIYIDTSRGSGRPVTVEPLVAALNLADSIAQSRLLLSWIEDQLPELKAVAGQFLSGQSGDTVTALRQPALDKLGLARANYEDALIRAQEIALSWGVLLGLWNLGTGLGTVEAAEAAYRGGLEAHRLNRRPLLPSPTNGGPTDAPPTPTRSA